MACKNSIPKELELLEIQSYIKGYHAYKDSWTPVLGEENCQHGVCISVRGKN